MGAPPEGSHTVCDGPRGSTPGLRRARPFHLPDHSPGGSILGRITIGRDHLPEPVSELAGDGRAGDVLRVTALYQRAGEAHQRLPNDVSAELAERWGTTNENIRAIRSRAMKKLKTFLERRGAWGSPDHAVQPGEVS